MPNKLTNAEVKKALECCIKSSHLGECFENECPLVSEEGCKVGKETLYPYVLDLINRQEGENEKNENIIRIADKTIETLNAEIESLQRQLNNAKLHQKETHKALQDEKALRLNEDFIKAEAYKECIEKVKEEMSIWSFDFSYYSDRTEAQKNLDNLLKEFERKENTIYDD